MITTTAVRKALAVRVATGTPDDTVAERRA